MAREPDDFMARVLRDIQATLADHGHKLDQLMTTTAGLQKQLDELSKFVTYIWGQSSQTQFTQAEDRKRLDELFLKVERLVARQPDGFSDGEQERLSSKPHSPKDQLSDLIDRFAALSPEERNRQLRAADETLRAELNSPREPRS